MRSAVLIPSTIAIVLLSLSRLAHSKEIFSGQPIWSSDTATSGGDGIARFIDFDRDGDLDFVTSAPAHEAVLGDIDQDGDLDLAVGCRDQAHIYENLFAQNRISSYTYKTYGQ